MNNPNSLFNNFHNYQQGRMPVHNNNLLRNNPVFAANMNRSQQINQMQMNEYYRKMQYMKMFQEMKKEKLKSLGTMNNDDIKKAIINPEMNDLTDQEKQEISVNYDQLKDKYGDDGRYKKGVQKYWEQRTNEPYKNILKNEDYTKNFKKEEDLIVHKVTDLDKDEEKLEFEFKDLEDKIEKHNKDLKIIYSSSKEAENKKKFEYNNVYKFRIKYDPKDHDEKKKDKIEYYKKEQKKIEKGNKKFNEIVESMVNNDLFDKDQLEKLGITVNDDEIEVDIDKITQIDNELKNSLGEEEYNNIMNTNGEEERSKKTEVREESRDSSKKLNEIRDNKNEIHESNNESRKKDNKAVAIRRRRVR